MSIRLAWRSVWRNRRRTIITVFSMGMGMAIAVFFIAFGDGMYYQLVDDAARLQAGHVTLEHPDYRMAPAVDLFITNTDDLRRRIKAIPGVAQTKRMVLGQGVARTGTGSVGVAVIGVEPSVEQHTSPLSRHIVKGKYLEDDDGPMIVVGEKLARQLKVDVGKKVVITANDADGVLVEELFRVKGIFKTGTDAVDGYMLQAPIGHIADLFGLPENAATQLGVVLQDSLYQDKIYKEIKTQVKDPGVAVRAWQEIMPELASYIKIDKTSNIVFQGMLIALILFTILNTILMSVMERKREFAALQAFGTPPGLLRAQVLWESVFISLMGCLSGVLMGWGVSVWTAHTGIDITAMLKEGSDISGFAVNPIVHPKVIWDTLAWPPGLVFVATMLLALFVVRRINDRDIADTLRHG